MGHERTSKHDPRSPGIGKSLKAAKYSKARMGMPYDETDINHCILLGEYQILEEAVKAGRAYKEKECPEAVVELYKMVKVL